MHKLFLLAALATLSFGAQAQLLKPAQVPAAVMAAFKTTFPTMKATTWEKEDAAYEAGFKQNGIKMSALFSPAGALIETETEVAVAKLPAAVRTALTRDYPASKVTEAATIVSATGVTTYEAEVLKNGKKQDVLFDADGSRVKK